MAAIDDLKANVAAQTSVVSSVKTLLAGLHSHLSDVAAAPQPDQSAQIEQLAAQIKANEAELAAAVAANQAPAPAQPAQPATAAPGAATQAAKPVPGQTTAGVPIPHKAA